MFQMVRDLSIRLKIMLSMCGILALAVVITLLYFSNSQSRALQAGLESKVKTIAEMLSWNLVPAVDAYDALKDPKPVMELLDSAYKDPELKLISVESTGPTKTLIAGVKDKDFLNVEIPNPSEPPRVEFRDKLHVVASINKEDGTPLGAVRLTYSLDDYNNKQNSVWKAGALMGIVVFIIGFFLAFAVSHGITRSLGFMTSTFKRMADGDLNQKSLPILSQDEIGFLAKAFNELLIQMKELGEQAKTISEGNLTREINIRGDLAEAFGRMKESITDLTTNFNELSSAIEKQTSEMLINAKQQESGASQQAATVAEITSTMEELAATARQIANNTESVTKSAEEAALAVCEGRDSLASLVESMNSIEDGNKTISDNIGQLNRHVQQIRGIVDLINDIADRSDLLALNAALEGTKAGDAGKGFLLVAAEMRRLAENVFTSTAEIKQLISEVTEATNTTVMATETGMKITREGVQRAIGAEKAFTRIVQTIEETTKAAKQISLASQQQRAATDQTVSAMGEVSEVVQQWVGGLRNTSHSVGVLSTITAHLRNLVSKYQTPMNN
jgi:methyl-accepting chemotaxis protein